MTPKELIRWLTTLNPDSDVCIDEGGLTLVEVLDGTPTVPPRYSPTTVAVPADDVFALL